MNNYNDYMNFLDNLYDGCFSITNKKKKGFKTKFKSKYLYAYQKAIDIYSKEFIDNSLSIERTDEEDYCMLVRKDRDDDLTLFWNIVERFKREMSI